MKRIIQDCKKNIWVLLSPIIVMAALLLVYAIKGIYPFGNRTVSYFDMSQLCVPIYYHIYDVLHLKSDVFLNWNAGLGACMADTLGSYLYFPTNLFFLFVKRSKILESMSFFLMLQLSVAAFSMTLYANKIKAEKVYAVFCGIAYSSCGFAIQYYTNIATFLDSLIVFPILMLAYYQLIKEKKYLLYVICIVLVMFCNVQSAFSVVIYLLFKTAFYLLEIQDKTERKLLITRLFFSSLIGVLISSFYLVPGIVQLLQASRMLVSEGTGYFSILESVICDFQQHKSFMLYGTEFIFSVILLLIIKKNIKKYRQNIFMILVLFLPIFFENINILWHAGSYKLFPMRFGYMLTFECLNLFLICKDELELKGAVAKIASIICISMIPLTTIVLYHFLKFFHGFGIRDAQIYLSYWVIIALLFITYLGVVGTSSNQLRKVCFSIIVCIQCFLGFWGFVGVEYRYSDECEDDIIINSELVNQQLSSLEIVYDHSKDVNNYLNANYPFITSTTAASSWVNGVSSNLLLEMIRMGYTNSYTRTLDCGGTALTDSVLGYKYAVINGNNYNKDLYMAIDEKNMVKCFSHNLDFGTCTHEILEEKDAFGFEYQNYLYKKLVNTNEQLFYELNIQDVQTYYDENTGDYVKKLNVYISGKAVLYLWSIFTGAAEVDNIYSIMINGNNITVPYLYHEGNTWFPQEHRSGFLELGIFENEEIEIEIHGYMEDFYNMQIGYMDYERFENYIELENNLYEISDFNTTNSRVSFNVNLKENCYYTLPIGYSDNWIARVNGDRTEIYSNYNGAFVSLKLDSGLNRIELFYVPKGLILGIVLSTIGLLAYISFIKFEKIILYSALSSLLYYIFLAIVLILLLVFYIFPMLYTFYIMFKNHISVADIITYIP